MFLAFQIAQTQMRTRMKQSIIAGLGVTFGIGMFILMISFMTGVNKLLEDTTLTSSPHIRLYNEISAVRPSVLEEVNTGNDQFNVVLHQKPKNSKLNLKDGFRVVEALRKDSRVWGVSPLLSTQVFYNYGPIQLNGVVQGVDIIQEDRLFEVSSKMKLGRIENLLASGNGIIMGHGLAKKLNVTMGDKITISTPTGQVRLLKIVGIFQYGIGAIDDIRSYASISTVQKIMVKDPGYITDINVKLKDLNLAKTIAPEYQRKYGFKAVDWETANATILFTIFKNYLETIFNISTREK
ncbi:MAG: ABC transporter permease, partial [Cytophagales bacterium]|nr:ABC transporter permease [Cytophagales bacterium]